MTVDRTGWMHGPDVRLVVKYGQEVYPAVTFDTLLPGESGNAVVVPAALWAAYLAARAELARVTTELVSLDPSRPEKEWLDVHLRKVGGYDEDPDPDG